MPHCKAITIILAALLSSLAHASAQSAKNDLYMKSSSQPFFGDNFNWHWDRASGYISSARLASFDSNVVTLREKIAMRHARGKISANQAAYLNSRLDRLVKLENESVANGGGLTVDEFNQLIAGLNSVRVVLIGEMRWY